MTSPGKSGSVTDTAVSDLVASDARMTTISFFFARCVNPPPMATASFTVTPTGKTGAGFGQALTHRGFSSQLIGT